MRFGRCMPHLHDHIGPMCRLVVSPGLVLSYDIYIYNRYIMMLSVMLSSLSLLSQSILVLNYVVFCGCGN